MDANKKKVVIVVVVVLCVVGLLVVGAILMAGALGFSAARRYASANTAAVEANAQSIRQATLLYLVQSPGTCPSVADLVEGRLMDPSRGTSDAWQTDFQISCAGDLVQVTSAGPDRSFGSEDDIVAR